MANGGNTLSAAQGTPMDIRRVRQLFRNWRLSKAEKSRPRSMGELARCRRGERVLATKTLGVCTALCLLAFPASTFAADAGLPLVSPVSPNMPRAGFFVGLGGSYNSVKVDRDLYASAFPMSSPAGYWLPME